MRADGFWPPSCGSSFVSLLSLHWAPRAHVLSPNPRHVWGPMYPPLSRTLYSILSLSFLYYYVYVRTYSTRFKKALGTLKHFLSIFFHSQYMYSPFFISLICIHITYYIYISIIYHCTWYMYIFLCTCINMGIFILFRCS